MLESESNMKIRQIIPSIKLKKKMRGPLMNEIFLKLEHQL